MTNHLHEKAITRNLPSNGEQRTAVLAVHGRNQDPQFILDICARLGWGHLPTIAPKATESSWYPRGFMLPVKDNEPELTFALENIQQKLDELQRYGFKREQIVILGFAQGACLAAEFASRQPGKFKALVLLTGGLIGERLRTKYSGDFEQTPVFITTSEIDERVPVSRVKETVKAFEAMKASVMMKIYKDRKHEVSDDEIHLVNEMIPL